MFKLDYEPHYINELDDILNEAMENGISTNRQNISFYNIVCAFDIESTSFTDKITKDDHNEKRSIMYIWQLAINGRVIIGRTWSEFLYVIGHIANNLETSKHKRLIIYVHNLSFEFQFIRKLFEWDKVFAIDTRKPIYGITKSGIEFRCSYILTNYSLAKLGEQLHKYKVSKLVGDLDYKLLRHNKTELTDQELQYCINDVLVVSAYIKEQEEKEKYIHNIPLTCTGYCRRFVRHNCLYKGGYRHWRETFNRYHSQMLSLTIADIDEYKQLKRAFQGGFTHAASYWSGYTVDDVDSIDFTSSYPYVLLSEKFPMSSGQIVKIHSTEELENYLKNYCCLFDCKFFDIKSRFQYENYISSSKCMQKTGAVINNGRVFSADMLAMTCTEVDFDIIRKVYKFSRCDIYNFRIYEKGYLPIEIIESIIKLYSDKTTLKGVKGKEQEYQVSKGLLNSVYGMMVTDIIRDTIVYSDDWSIEPADPKKLIDTYNKSRKRFLFYPWGVWCTAYARKNLWTGIVEFKEDYIYSDTDSIKCKNIEKHRDYIEKYNRMCERKLKHMCDHYKLSYSLLLPKTIKGVEKPLGVWDWETKDNIYKKFKTLGAKRYMVYQGDDLSLTVSGVNKKFAIPYLKDQYSIDDCFEAFNEGLIIPEQYTGKLTHYYIDKEYKGTITDYKGVSYDYDEKSGIYLEPAAYCFDISLEYIEFLKGFYYTKL